ncbi:hypothetical protein Fmac_029054 [Flemingia macrophylla]|uniref:Uncharacterized protein n=1 Tax=Flemingia macrophylla TaxID=520843 RepID=A0ABD1L987_9FABA
MEVVGLMLREFVDEYIVRDVDVFVQTEPIQCPRLSKALSRVILQGKCLSLSSLDKTRKPNFGNEGSRTVQERSILVRPKAYIQFPTLPTDGDNAVATYHNSWHNNNVIDRGAA